MLLSQAQTLLMLDQPGLLTFESVGADQLLSVAFDAIQPRNVSERNVGDFGLHGAGIIEFPSRMRPSATGKAN